MISGRVPRTIAIMGCSFHHVQCTIHRSTNGKDNCDHDLSWVVWDERRFSALMALHGRSGCEGTCVRSVGPVGISERGFDLFCWLSRFLVSPAGSTGFVETLKRSRYIHPERGEDPYRIPRTFVASGGIAIPPYAPPPFGTYSFSPQYGEAQKPDIRRKAAEVHGTNDYVRGFLMGKNSKILLLKWEKNLFF